MTLNHITDTHSHYDDPRFDGIRDELISSLFSRGISAIIHAADTVKSSEYGVAAAQKYPRYFTAVGIHPEHANGVTESELERISELAKSPKVVAIGEIGLDYHYEGYDSEAQKRLFEYQIKLAQSLELPIIVHSRDATGDCMDILRRFAPVSGVMHCFSGSVETAREVLSLGMHISFTGVITFKNSKKAVQVLESMPLDRLLLETDCPYMAPEPFRGKTCDSSMIEYIAKKEAKLLDISLDKLLLATEENARRLFKLW